MDLGPSSAGFESGAAALNCVLQVAAPPVAGLGLDALEQAQWHAQAVAPVPADR